MSVTRYDSPLFQAGFQRVPGVPLRCRGLPSGPDRGFQLISAGGQRAFQRVAGTLGASGSGCWFAQRVSGRISAENQLYPEAILAGRS